MFFIVGCCLTIFTGFCSVKHFCQEYYVGDLLAFSVPHIRKHDNSFILLLGMLILMAWLWQCLEDFSIVKEVVPFEMKSPVSSPKPRVWQVVSCRPWGPFWYVYVLLQWEAPGILGLKPPQELQPCCPGSPPKCLLLTVSGPSGAADVSSLLRCVLGHSVVPDSL